ncbi:helix-turn-helix domain-containing protein [Bacillus sp. BGMRC 2118]|nr:helix-turn-helix domain-containing protein [Bacillus sp. BGMRC 2118]
MSTQQKRTYKRYSPEKKKEAIQRVKSGESYLQVAKELGVVDPDYIYKWIDRFNKEGEISLYDKRSMKANKTITPEEKNKLLEAENEILKKYLAILNKEGFININ